MPGKSKKRALNQRNDCYGSLSQPKKNRQANIATYFSTPVAPISKASSRMKNRETLLSRPKDKKRRLETSMPKAATQMYLDLGQKSFAQNKVCKICGMLYVHGVAEDAATHQKVCRNFTHGVLFRNMKSCRIVVPRTSLNDGAIIEVRSSDSSSLLQKVEEVRKIAHKELGFVANESDARRHVRKVFLFVKNHHIVGYLAVEPISKAHVLLKKTLQKSSKSVSATMGVHTIWVQSNCRGQKIASHLLDAARTKFSYGVSCIPSREIAFSSPTNAGISFATWYLRREGEGEDESKPNVLVYDCF